MAQTTVDIIYRAIDQSKAGTASFQRNINFVRNQVMQLAGAYIGARGLYAGLKSVVSASMEQEKAERELAAALGITGENIRGNIKGFIDFASQMQRLTIYSDEQILSQMAYAKNLGVTEDKLKEATQAAIGLAARYRLDLSTAMQLVGRASQGQTQMLTRYGIVLDQNLTAEQKYLEILRRGTESFHLAEQATKSAAGALEQLKNAFDDLKQSPTVIEAVNASVGTLTKLLRGAKEAMDLFTTKGPEYWGRYKSLEIEQQKSLMKAYKQHVIERGGRENLEYFYKLLAAYEHSAEIQARVNADINKTMTFREEAIRKETESVTAYYAFYKQTATEAGQRVLEEQINNVKKEIELTESVTEAYRSMYGQMGRMTDENYKHQVRLLDELAAKYTEVTKDELAIAAWYNEQRAKLDIEHLRDSKSVLDGIRAGYMQIKREQLEWGQVGYQMTYNLRDAMINATDSMRANWRNWKDASVGFIIEVANALRRLAAQMFVEQAAMPFLSNIFGGIIGGITGAQLGAVQTAAPPSWATAGLPGYQRGGVTRNEGLVYAHSDEAFVPLDGGRSIPVEFNRDGPKAFGDVIIHIENRGMPINIERKNLIMDDETRVVRLVINNYHKNGDIRDLLQGVLTGA